MNAPIPVGHIKARDTQLWPTLRRSIADKVDRRLAVINGKGATLRIRLAAYNQRVRNARWYAYDAVIQRGFDAL